jgi:hypothetical protein
MTEDSHCFSEEEDNTPQAPYPSIDRSQPMLSDAYRSSYAECRRNDSLHMQGRQHCTLHPYHSNAQRSRSVPLIIAFTLVSYDTHLSLIIFKIITHPMTLLTAIPLQVIIYILTNTTYFRLLTVALLIRCLVVISQAFASVLPFP